MIGDPTCATVAIGGSISNNDPAADYPAALSASAAPCRLPGARWRPTISSPAYSRPPSTAPRSSPRAACYMKFKNPASRYAIVGVFVAHTSPQTWSGAAHTTQFIRLQRGTLYSPLAAANGCAVDSVDDPPPGSILETPIEGQSSGPINTLARFFCRAFAEIGDATAVCSVYLSLCGSHCVVSGEGF